MNILHVSSATGLGGGEAHLVDLCRALIRRGHAVHVVVRPHTPLIEQLRAAAIPFELLRLRHSLDLASAWKLSRLIRRLDIDILHGHVARDYPVCAMAEWLAGRARLVLTRHHYLPLKRNWGYRRMFRRVAKIIAVSEFVRQQLIASLELPSHHVVTIPNWINLDQYRTLPDRHQARARFGLSAPFVVGLVGQLTPAKGQEEFIRAASRIAAIRDDVLFVIVGKEQGKETRFTDYLHGLVRQLALSHRVRFLHWVDDLPQLYAALSILVVPSWFEAFSLVLIQALAAGVPVIASNVGGPAEIVVHEETGLLVPPRQADALAEAIDRLLNDGALRERLGRAGQQDVCRRFEREMVIDRIEAVYRNVLDSR
ncbi:MAG: glycosyltransferase [Acidobacteriota bacterium]|nr:glycosyltransferase [Blastocatellia bacterium]MDW8240138.1 glycosyltransferase [Acidobacteriota bacterium]